MRLLPETALCSGLVVWVCAAGCASAPTGTARAPSSAADSTPAAPSPPRGRWLLHGRLLGPLTATGTPISYLATWLGPEHAGRTVPLPSSYSLSFSPDGKWLALCGPDPSGASPDTAPRASVIRFEGESISEPVAVGACQSLEWAPTGARLLVKSDSNWKLLEFSGSKPVVRELGARLAGPVNWSPSGRYFVAPERDAAHALALVSLLEPELSPQPLELFGLPRGACSWSSADALACAVERNGKPALVLAQVGTASAGSEARVAESALPLGWLSWGTNRVVAYELARGGGVYAFGEGLPATRLFEPQPKYAVDYFSLSPTGRWLLDCAGNGARLWDLASVPRSVPLPGLPDALMNPRWSPDGKHALLGVREARHGGTQTDVWLVSEASTEPKLARVASFAPGRQFFARFSPGSNWVLVTVASDAIPLAAGTRSPGPEPEPNADFAVNIASRAVRSLPRSNDWSPDDSVFVVNQDPRLLAFRVRGSAFAGPEDLGSTGPGLRLVWQP